MASNAVSGFLPSRHGFHFANRWPPGPARVVEVGSVRVPIGEVSRGLCGGMAFAARDRFVRGEVAPPDASPPPYGTPLFTEIVDRQFDSFGIGFTVPIVFWLAAISDQVARDRTSIRDTWPAIRSAIDAGRLAMVGLVRNATWNPLALDLGHQVVAYRYEESAASATFWIYDPNHPDDDSVRITLSRGTDGVYAMTQSTGEPLLGVLALPG